MDESRAVQASDGLVSDSWSVPVGMVARPAQTNAVAAALVAGTGPVVVTGAYGGGGFGRTMVARMVVARGDVRAAFPGGVLWVDVGQHRRRGVLAATIDELCLRLGGGPSRVAGPEAAAQKLAVLLAARPATLVVVDDVWYADQLAPFLDVPAATARHLITTRVGSPLPRAATAVAVDDLDEGEARRVLLDGVVGLPEDRAAGLLRQVGGWALALKSVNAILRTAGAERLDLGRDGGRQETINAILRASLGLLDEPDRQRCLELGVLAADADIDVDLLSRLWGDAPRLASALHELNLVEFRPHARTLRVHDVVRSYLRDQLGTAEARAAHEALLAAYGGRAWWELPDSAGYLWRHLAMHLAAAGRGEELRALAEDLRWAQARLARYSPAALDADLALTGGPTVTALRRALRLEGHLLGAIEPAHSHTDTVAARLDTDPDLAAAVVHLRASQPAGRLRVRPGWTLPDSPHPAVLRILDGHANTVTALAIAPDGTWLATISDDQTVRIWDVATGTTRTTFAAPTETWAGVVAIAPDGAWLATASREKTARIFEVGGGIRATLTGHTNALTDVAIAPDGTWLATASWDRTVRIWDAATGAIRATLTGHTSTVYGVAVASDGTWLATASADQTVRLWDAATGAIRATLTGDTLLTGVAIAPDSTWLATTSDDQTVRIWDVATGTVSHTLRGHTDQVTAVAIAPDGSWLATASLDTTVRIWDATTGAIRTTFAEWGHRATGVAISPDATWLATTGRDQTVRLWDTTNRITRTGNVHRLNGLALAPDGTWLATTGDDAIVRIWDAATGAARTTFTGLTEWTVAVAIAPDGTWLATVSHRGQVQLWDIATGTTRTTISDWAHRVNGLAISADGTWLATVTPDHDTVRIWDSGTGALHNVFVSQDEGTTGVAIAPDGTWLATTSHEPTVRIWEVATGATRATLVGHTGPVNQAAIAPDGTWLATAGRDRTVRIWDVATGAIRATLVGHTGPVTGVAIAPDGTWLATTSSDRTVRIWDSRTGANTASMRVSGALAAIAISPRTSTLYVTGARLYRFDIEVGQ
ncbi:MAG TPA: NB-ARC domain-containing protein [Micromonosporaceae bacterium]